MLSSRSYRLTRSLHQRKIWALTHSTHLHTDEKVIPRHCKRPRRNHSKHCSASKSRICFSTVSKDQNEGIKVSSSETAPIDHLKKVTDRLVESEIGSLSQASILEITTSISSWHTQAITNPLDENNFDRSEALLSRLIDEFRSDDCSVKIQSQIGIDIINRVLDTWRIVCNEKAPNRFRNQPTAQQNDDSIIHRGPMLLRELYTVNSDMQPNDKSFNIILDTYAKYGMTEESRILLDEMIEVSNKDLPQCRPDTVTYNTLISAYANAITISTASNQKITHANAAIEVLHDMLNLYNETKNPDIKPDVISFSTVIAACANAASASPSFAQNAEDILHEMSEMYNSSLIENGGDGEWLGIMPTNICYSSVINAWSNSGVVDAVDRASHIFEEMQGNGVGATDVNIEGTTALIGAYANSEGKDGIRQAENLLMKAQNSDDNASIPTSITYTAFIDCLAQAASRVLDGDGGEAAMKAEAIVKQMEEMYENGNHELKPSIITMNALINVWAKTHKHNSSGERAEYWLDEVENREDIMPDSTTYTSVIDAYSRNGNGRKAERILSRMIHAAKSGNDMCQPTMFSFSSAINAYANNGKPRDAVRILDLMKKLQQEEGWTHLVPDSFCYNGIINSFLKSGQRDSMRKCIALLTEMEELGVATAVSHTAVIEGLSKTQNLHSGKKQVSETAEDLLNRMWHLYDDGNQEMMPTSVTYNSIINLFSKMGLTQKAEFYLDELDCKYKELQNEELRPNNVSYNTCLSSFAKAGNEKDAQRCEQILRRMQESDDEYLRPDSFTMTNVISAWAHSNNPERAEEILNTMQSLYEQGDEALKPTIVSFGAVLNAWARQGNIARAEAIVNHMEELMNVEGYEEMRPNTVIYNILINCHAKSRERGAFEKTEAILAKMNKFKGTASPTTVTYNSMLSALHYSAGDNYVKAKELLWQMEEASKNDPSIQLETITFTTFFRILAKSKVSQKSMIAEGILDRMEKDLDDVRFRPNNFTYDAVLQICKQPATNDARIRRHHLLLAVKTLTKMQELPHVRPTSFTYAEFYMAVGNLTKGDELHKLVNKSFEDCCKAGLLDDKILSVLKRIAPESFMRNLLGTDNAVTTVSSLPKSWSRNSKFSVTKKNERVTQRSVHNTGRSRIRRNN